MKAPVIKHHRKVLQRRYTEETENIGNDVLPLVLSMSVFFMTIPTPIHPQQLRRFEKEKVTVLPPSPPPPPP